LAECNNCIYVHSLRSEKVVALKSCQVYVANEAIYVFPVSVSEFGIGLTCKPFFRLDRASSPIEMGRTVSEALTHSKEGIPHPRPEDLRSLEKEMVAFTGRKTWGTFARSVRGAADVGFDVDGKAMVIIPYARGERNSFVPVNERAVSCSPDEQTVGTHILSKIGPEGTDRLSF